MLESPNKNADPHMSSWFHTTYERFERWSPNFETWKQTIILYTSAKKHDLQMFSLRSCHVIRVRAPIHQHRTSRIPCSICQVSPCRRYSSTSRCKARLSRTVSGGYLAGIIWTVILATWMTWQAIHPFYIQPYTPPDMYIYLVTFMYHVCIMTPTWWENATWRHQPWL